MFELNIISAKTFKIFQSISILTSLTMIGLDGTIFTFIRTYLTHISLLSICQTLIFTYNISNKSLRAFSTYLAIRTCFTLTWATCTSIAIQVVAIQACHTNILWSASITSWRATSTSIDTGGIRSSCTRWTWSRCGGTTRNISQTLPTTDNIPTRTRGASGRVALNARELACILTAYVIA